jgi:hypothetical protein
VEKKMSGPRQVICMKWGTLYGPEYVNRLYAMVRRHIKGELRFVCLTDDAVGVRKEVECLPCPTVDVRADLKNTPWRKMALWETSDKLFGLSGDWLFLDLDVVVTGPLDELFEYLPEKTFIVMQNWTQPGQGIGNTSVFRFRVGANRYLLDKLLPNFEEYFRKYIIEQIYICREINEVTFWPDEWCILFKVQCVPIWPLNFWKTPELPATARVVAFPGDPGPLDALAGQWPVKAAWKKLYKHTKPVPWVADLWLDAEKHIGG